MLDRKTSASDFYGSSLRLCLIGFLRPEQKFTSFDALITQINADIQQTRELCADFQAGGQIAEGRKVAMEFFNSSYDYSDNDKNRLIFQKKPLSFGK